MRGQGQGLLKLGTRPHLVSTTGKKGPELRVDSKGRRAVILHAVIEVATQCGLGEVRTVGVRKYTGGLDHVLIDWTVVRHDLLRHRDGLGSLSVTAVKGGKVNESARPLRNGSFGLELMFGSDEIVTLFGGHGANAMRNFGHGSLDAGRQGERLVVAAADDGRRAGVVLSKIDGCGLTAGI